MHSNFYQPCKVDPHTVKLLNNKQQNENEIATTLQYNYSYKEINCMNLLCCVVVFLRG